MIRGVEDNGVVFENPPPDSLLWNVDITPILLAVITLHQIQGYTLIYATVFGKNKTLLPDLLVCVRYDSLLHHIAWGVNCWVISIPDPIHTKLNNIDISRDSCEGRAD